MEQGNLRCDVNVSLAADRQPRVGHPHRDQERQLAALGGAGGALRDAPAGRRPRRGRPDRAGDPALPRGHRQHLAGPEQGGGDRLPVLPRARPRADRPGRRSGSRSCAAALPELPAARRARLSEEWGIAPTEMAWLVNAGAVELVSDTVAAGASPADARKWWLGELARRANDAGVELADLAVTPAQVAELVGLVAAGTHQRPAGPAGPRRRAGRRGRPGAGRRGPRPGRHGGVRRAGRRRGRRDRRATRTSPRRSAAARCRRSARWSARS